MWVVVEATGPNVVRFGEPSNHAAAQRLSGPEAMASIAACGPNRPGQTAWNRPSWVIVTSERRLSVTYAVAPVGVNEPFVSVRPRQPWLRTWSVACHPTP